MARCVVTRTLPGDALERLTRAHHEVEVWPHQLPPDADTLAELCADADAVVCTVEDEIDDRLLSRCPRLRAIANYAVGCDNIDVSRATALGIGVSNTPEVLTEATADLGFCLMLAAARRIVEGARIVRDGEWKTWDPRFLLGFDVFGRTLGIIGFGRIGQAVARRGEGFSMRVVWSGRSGGEALEHVLADSDFVVLTCPLTAETFHLIDDRALEAMRPSAILVNIARGAIVDSAALERALKQRRIAAAALDVTDPEPLAPDHPLLSAPNLLVVPHIGSATHATRQRMADIAIDNVLAALAGERMPQCINCEVYGEG